LYGRLADAFIADTYDPPTGACGATGKTHHWDITRMLVKRAKRPVILAGDSIRRTSGRYHPQVRPAGGECPIPVSRTRQDARTVVLVRRFVAAAREAFKER
jgi:phosphoribosylanthranilate isomerase